MNATTIRPGRLWYLLPVAIALLAVMFVPVAIYKAVTDRNIFAFQFKAPGGKEFEIQRPGKYVLWNETQTFFEGQTYSSSTNLPGGMRFELLELDTKTTIPMTADASTDMTTGSTARHSVGTFEVGNPGKYRISVEGQFPDRIFYFRESLWRQLGPILQALRLAAIGFVVAIALGVFILLRRSAAR